jgi:hypothetical protein
MTCHAHDALLGAGNAVMAHTSETLGSGYEADGLWLASLREGSSAMNWRFYTGIFVFLMLMAILTVRAQPMSVEDYAKTASRTAVMANVCPRFFKVNIEQMSDAGFRSKLKVRF